MKKEFEVPPGWVECQQNDPTTDGMLIWSCVKLGQLKYFKRVSIEDEPTTQKQIEKLQKTIDATLGQIGPLQEFEEAQEHINGRNHDKIAALQLQVGKLEQQPRESGANAIVDFEVLDAQLDWFQQQFGWKNFAATIRAAIRKV